ncbi:ESX secretion-associated protein EspG [Gordonia sp. zg691]|uniref:ESX secretion-associated protein EspG n=1 Tax=Gordonia jinghuaiqii TaxID=2758710 RepID=A0A7D7R1R2_9ACTN|nr:ESX secretion-associated protein EspG [Gordonia jinghuaiqii]MBD0860863.1 ESX secretion-associated protein EspG [Gordonia jinghuaiqii]MCR5979576.1 ESX secretion-associated protein EspG [Gordonia jinghuaiqii]QMT00632.1 ESX secretion-associated protein EspG [Gordonia jinghuaiqii]
MMPTIHEVRLALDAEVLRRLGERFGVQTWPVVLDIADTAQDEAARRAADRESDATIDALGLIEQEEPTPVAATVLRVLARPQREIEIRSYSESGVRRICLARNGYQHVLAVRNDDRVEVEVVEVPDVGALASLVRAQFADVTPCEFTAISKPAEEVVERLGRARTGTETTDALHALGATPADAGTVSSALASCRVRTEIVASSGEDGRFSQSSGAVAIFDTDRGRIVASPSKSPDGRVWTTLSPGSGHRIAQAVSLLIETLPDEKWMP